jgi:hypothetical protein
MWMLADIRPDGFFFAGTDDFLLSLWNGDYLLNDEAFGGQTLGSVADAFLFPVAATGADAIAVPEASPSVVTACALAMLACLARRR